MIKQTLCWVFLFVGSACMTSDWGQSKGNGDLVTNVINCLSKCSIQKDQLRAITCRKESFWQMRLRSRTLSRWSTCVDWRAIKAENPSPIFIKFSYLPSFDDDPVNHILYCGKSVSHDYHASAHHASWTTFLDSAPSALVASLSRSVLGLLTMVEATPPPAVSDLLIAIAIARISVYVALAPSLPYVIRTRSVSLKRTCFWLTRPICCLNHLSRSFGTPAPLSVMWSESGSYLRKLRMIPIQVPEKKYSKNIWQCCL